MPKRQDIKKILIIGSGPIVIGQAAEFDYAGTQACIALREEGYTVILANSNPATIMTDPKMADKVYMEPLTLEYIDRILRKECPDAIIPGIGGQTGLNLAIELEKRGILAECNVELLGTNSSSIERAEDRELFKELCKKIGEPVIPSEITYSKKEALKAAERIGYPVVLRPAFTLGGTGGGFAENPQELLDIADKGFALSPVGQVLVEKSVKGYKEIEFEVMRDSADHVITICGMENIDPVGVHTGDSAVVAPILSLSKEEEEKLNTSAIKLIRALDIQGGCNVQFALHPDSGEYFLIEVNPRVSRSSALASKASGYPIARITAKVAVGMLLDEIPLAGTTAAKAPSLQYIVSKLPRFPFDKFTQASNLLGTQMKATGEVMGIGASFSESILKAVRSLETGVTHFHKKQFDTMGTDELLTYITVSHDDSLYAVFELLRRGIEVSTLHELCMITPYFLYEFEKIVALEKVIKASPYDENVLKEAKKAGFSDAFISHLWSIPELEVFNLRQKKNIFPIYRMVDTLHAGAYIPYFYASYTGKSQSICTLKTKKVVLGAGPIRIGQGVEFDYSTVHAVDTIRQAGYEAVIINNNPETVSTDYTTADKLYFEPLTPEDVYNVMHYEGASDAVASLGGQTAVNLASPLAERGINIIGTDCDAIARAEDRKLFEALLEDLSIPQPRGCAVTSIEEGILAAKAVGYPVMVRPSFVLGGRAMEIVANEKMLTHYLRTAVEIDHDRPVLVDHYVSGREVEVDAISDGRDIFVPGIMELVERTGIHSGDSCSIYPSFSISDKVKGTILTYTKQLGLAIGIKGLYNIQFIVDKSDKVFVIEVNPRSSRTVPFLSKSTGYPLADIATRVILGVSLKEQGIFDLYPPEKKRWYVKVPVFSFNKLHGMDPYLSPEMKSTGEAIGYDKTLHWAMYKALQASGIKLYNHGKVMISVADEDKEETLPLAKRFYDLGFSLEATTLTAAYLNDHGVRTRSVGNISEGSLASVESLSDGHVRYFINTRAILSGIHYGNGSIMRMTAAEHGVPIFSSLDTVRMVLEVLESMTNKISTIDEE